MSDYKFDIQDDIGLLTLTRPDVLNALTLEIYAEMRDLLKDLQTESRMKVLVLTGEGRAFCSGGDVEKIIGKLLKEDMRAHLEFTRMTGEVVRNMRRLDKPIIAAVNGIAAGAGAVLALASDLRVVAESASFSFLFTLAGLTGADMGAAYLLPRVVGMGRASEILMLGEKVEATTAERIGLANRVVPDEELLTVSMAMARQLADGPSFALAATKRMIENEWNMDLTAALEAEAQVQALMMMGEDHKAFYEAFKSKVKPEFKGR